MIACYKGHLKIAKYLIDAKADVNRKSVKGNTALHDCAESGSLEIMKLLLANIAKIDVDAYGMTPLLAAAVTGHIHIVEYLIANPDLVSRQERIDALELLGATFVDKKRDMLGSYKLWKRAMEDRCVTFVFTSCYFLQKHLFSFELLGFINPTIQNMFKVGLAIFSPSTYAGLHLICIFLLILNILNF